MTISTLGKVHPEILIRKIIVTFLTTFLEAHLGGVVGAAGDQPPVHPVPPRHAGEAAVAAEAADVAARYQVLGGVVEVDFALRGDARAVRHGLDGSQRLHTFTRIQR